MTESQAAQSAACPTPSGPGLFFAAVGAAAVATVFAFGLVLVDGYSPLLPVALPLLAAAGMICLWHTWLGLCLVAFGIGPLNIIQAEVGGITVNVPEVLILLLFVKEGLRFLARGERPADFVPWGTLSLYLSASAFAVFTGLMKGNPPVKVLQDFRQFTEFVVLYLLLVHRVRGGKSIRTLLLFFVMGFTLLGLHGILQRYTGIGIPGLQQMSDLVYFRSLRSGSVYGATPLGAMMVFTLGVTIALILSIPRRSLEATLSPIAVIAVVAAVFTQTRASWLAMFVLVVMVFLLIRKTPLMIAIAIIGTLVFSATFGRQVVERMSQMRVTKSERSLRDRVIYYGAAWRIIKEHPVAGLGWGCYYNVHSIMFNDRYVQRRPLTEKAVATVHSAYLQLFVKGGGLVLGTFFLFLGSWGLRCFRAWRRKPRDELDYNLFICTAAALAAYLFHSTFENFFQWPVMAQSFWFLMALTAIMAAGIAQNGQLDPPVVEDADDAPTA